MRLLITLLLVMCTTSTLARAQVGELNRLIEGGVEDAELLLTRYMEPLAAGFGAGLNSGWTHAARPHRLLGFHVRAQSGLTFVPQADRTFQVAQGELNHLRLLNPEIGESPTFSGGRRADRYRFAIEPDGQPTGQEFVMPAGTGFAFVPAPVVQAGLGIGTGTAVMLRGFPSVAMGRFGTIGSFGVGVQHGLNQWIPGGRLFPLHLSVLLGYNALNMSASFEQMTHADQELSWRTDAWTINLVAGRSLILFNAYGGVGYERSSSRLQMLGTYTVAGPGGTSVTVTDPIDLSLSGSNDVKAFVGLRFNLALLGVRAEYTLAEYPTFNAGVSLSLR
jgi:hypothetical protein